MKSKESKETRNSTISGRFSIPELEFSLENPGTYGGITARIMQFFTVLCLNLAHDFVSKPLPYQQIGGEK